MIRRDPLGMSREELRDACVAVETLNRAARRRSEIRSSLPDDLSTVESWQCSTVMVVEELGDKLVHAIHEAGDRRVRTRAGAVKYLLRDIYDARNRRMLKVPAPELPRGGEAR